MNRMSSFILSRIPLAIAALVASFPAWPQTANVFPRASADKPVRVIVTTAAGSGIDQVTRPIMEKLSQRIGRPVVVDNRPGANGVIAVNIAAESAPDGMTLISTSNSFVINGVLKRFPFDIRKTFVPVAQISSQHYLVLCPASLPVSTFAELLDYARKNPGKISFGSGGMGSVGHLGMELIKVKTKIEVTHVPYKSNALAGLDLTAGRIQLLFSNIAGTQMVRAGKAKVIAVTTPKRMPAYSNVPTVAESGVTGFELSNTYTLYTLTKASPPAVAALNREIVQILASPDLRERLAADSSEVAPPYTPAELQKMFFAEYDKWDAVVKAANLTSQLLY
jgi:tripartite-type tricarboxylate transporter receptor subunit TctC